MQDIITGAVEIFADTWADDVLKLSDADFDALQLRIEKANKLFKPLPDDGMKQVISTFSRKT